MLGELAGAALRNLSDTPAMVSELPWPVTEFSGAGSMGRLSLRSEVGWEKQKGHDNITMVCRKLCEEAGGRNGRSQLQSSRNICGHGRLRKALDFSELIQGIRAVQAYIHILLCEYTDSSRCGGRSR